MAQRSRFISSIDAATDYLTHWCFRWVARIRALHPDAEVTPAGSRTWPPTRILRPAIAGAGEARVSA